MNILDYVKNKNVTFAKEPFNSVDSLVLCQLFYVRLEAVIEGEGRDAEHPGWTVRDFYRAEYFGEMFSDGITDEHNRELFTLAAASPRFRDIEVKYVNTHTDAAAEKQFAAATFVLDGETEYVAFRGTDGSMLGWKEDFNLSFMDEIPSQSDAVEYLNSHFGEGGPGADKSIYVGGHSKGGNLAVYGATMSDGSLHARIRRIYSFEGPGFKEDVSERLKSIAERDGIEVVKIVPKGSLIGMIMGSTDGVRVVDSDAVGIMQHAAFTWQLDGDDFVYKDDLSYSGAFNDRALRLWLEKFGEADRARFVDIVFGLLSDNNIDSVNDLKSMNAARTIDVLSSYQELDDETKKFMQRVLRGFAKAQLRAVPPESMTSRIEDIAERAERATESIKAGYEEWRGDK